jgi:hypothetical protein
VLGQRPAVVAGARPVAVGDLRDDVAALLERFEHDPMSNCAPSVFLTPISMLSKSMKTAIFSRVSAKTYLYSLDWPRLSRSGQSAIFY